MTSFKPIFIFALPLVAFISLLFLMRKKGFMFWTTFGLGAFCILFILAIGGVGIINDACFRFERFEKLERAGLLTEAKNHPEKYAPVFKHDLRQFKNSFEFKQYIKSHGRRVHIFVRILIVLSGVLLASYFIRLGIYVYKRIEKKDSA